MIKITDTTKLMFGTNINGTDETGLIYMEGGKPPQIVCLCSKEIADKILNALKPPLPPRPQIILNPEKDCGLGKCTEKNCTKYATRDYNGHNHFVCENHYESLTRFFEEEYN